MLVTYNGPAGFKVEHDAANLNEAFEFLGRCQEVFGAAEACQNCQGTDIKPQFRKNKDGHKFYSLVCQNCRWEFKFGQKQDDSSLFPKGWFEGYKRSDESQENQSQEQPRQQPAF